MEPVKPKPTLLRIFLGTRERARETIQLKGISLSKKKHKRLRNFSASEPATRRTRITRKPLMMEQNHELLQRQHSGIWRSLRDGDFEEEEVWDVVNEREKPQYNNKKTKQSFSSSSSSSSSSSVPLSVPRPLPSASRMIPRANSSNNIHTSTFNSAIIEGKVLQQSAPVNIPDWSKIYNINNNNKKKQSKRVSSSRFRQDYDFAEEDEGDKNEQVLIKYDDEEEDEDGEEENDEFDVKLPPHEFIARRLARTQISSFSVFEGVGRTLKGRDLSKVRNAVLTRTGFLESL